MGFCSAPAGLSRARKAAKIHNFCSAIPSNGRQVGRTFRMMIKRWAWLLCLIPTFAFGQQDLSGKWVVTTDIYGNPLAQKLTLKSDTGKLTGKFGGDDLQGTISGNAIHFIAKDKEGNASEYTGTISGDTFSGNAVMNETGDHPDRTTGAFTARRI